MPTAHVLPEADELLQQVATSLFKSRKIVVVTGAGISTNSGIPVSLSFPYLPSCRSFMIGAKKKKKKDGRKTK